MTASCTTIVPQLEPLPSFGMFWLNVLVERVAIPLAASVRQHNLQEVADPAKGIADCQSAEHSPDWENADDGDAWIGQC